MCADVAISLRGIKKQFGEYAAVKNISVDVMEGEFFSLLGPSGCGKTTTLRMVAGFERPDEGTILLRGQDVSAVGPDHRNVNMVFQQYALFPHMSVFDNVAFGLKVKKVPKEERRKRVLEMLEVVELAGFENRRPGQLSGGQQQRVALARALVNRPAALLLDEPLGALDVKMRKHMQLELKQIQGRLGTTFIYVTHDQDEAMAMSDRIAVMRRGVIDQVGPPRAIYERPSTRFVADFIGTLNTFPLRVDAVTDGVGMMRLDGSQRILFPASAAGPVGDMLTGAVRPECITLDQPDAPAGENESRLTGRVERAVYLGALTQFHIQTDPGFPLISYSAPGAPDADFSSGERVSLRWDAERTSVWRDE